MAGQADLLATDAFLEAGSLSRYRSRRSASLTGWFQARRLRQLHRRNLMGQ